NPRVGWDAQRRPNGKHHQPPPDDDTNPDDSDGFYRLHLPTHVQERFDALSPYVREMFAQHVKASDSPRDCCKERIKRLHSAKWPVGDMIDLARVYPHGFGILRAQTFGVFAELLIEIKAEEAGPYPGLAEALSATTWMQRNDPPPD